MQVSGTPSRRVTKSSETSLTSLSLNFSTRTPLCRTPLLPVPISLPLHLSLSLSPALPQFSMFVIPRTGWKPVCLLVNGVSTRLYELQNPDRETDRLMVFERSFSFFSFFYCLLSAARFFSDWVWGKTKEENRDCTLLFHCWHYGVFLSCRVEPLLPFRAPD